MQIKRHYFLPLVIFYSGFTLATEQCLVPVKPLEKHNLAKKGEILVKANAVSMAQDKLADFNGDVQIASPRAQIRAQNARIDKTARKLSASGDIRFQDRQLLVQSEDLQLDMDNNNLEMNQTGYRMLQFQGRGEAQKIVLSQQQGVSLQDVSFSTCPADMEDWKIKASSIELKPGDIWGEVRHARFYVKDIPVLYLPYFSFPVTNQRQSGLLLPEINSSDQFGLSYEQPIYWNIAPNYDATISPRVMTDRGLQLKNEFRYLTRQHEGSIHLEYMNKDNDTPDGNARYFYRLTHQGQLSEQWSLNAEWNQLSDDNYIVDLGSDFYNRADTHLFKTIALDYDTRNLDISARFRDFELIGDHPSSYRALPEVRLNYDAWQGEYLKLDLYSELSLFDNSDVDLPKAARLHVAPKLSLPWNTPWAEFLAETSILHTSYRQKNTEDTVLDKNVSRTLGQVRMYGTLAFERDTIWFGEDVTQTLEPKAQYLYTSYENQDNIGLYDTTRLLNDFQGLFRGQEFTGLDRISDKNQLTLGATTRIINKRGQELFKFSLGQIFFLSDSQILEAERQNSNRSALATELDWNISSRFIASLEAQVSSENERVERSSVSLEYRKDSNNLIQIAHRYVRDLSGVEINQAGITASWSIAPNWHWVGRYYRDLDLNRSTESYTGFQYDSCCWSLQIVWERHLTNRFDALGNQSLDEYDSGISLKFEFKGMGQGRSHQTLLRDGLYGYQQPYVIGQ